VSNDWDCLRTLLLNSPNSLFPVYVISGFAYGMVELIRRVIPRDIVGGDVSKVGGFFA
jgi:hypothetical protein